MKIENPAKFSTKKSKTKKVNRVETSLKQSNRDLSLFRFKSDAVIAFILFIVLLRNYRSSPLGLS
ncbi:hypothetical protein WN943_009605 [Citrus x changshan-huyou]